MIKISFASIFGNYDNATVTFAYTFSCGRVFISVG